MHMRRKDLLGGLTRPDGRGDALWPALFRPREAGGRPPGVSSFEGPGLGSPGNARGKSWEVHRTTYTNLKRQLSEGGGAVGGRARRCITDLRLTTPPAMIGTGRTNERTGSSRLAEVSWAVGMRV